MYGLVDDSSEYRKAEKNGEQRRVDLLIEKIKKALEWPVPRKVKDIQKFLRLENYYWRFVKNFSKIAKPLYKNDEKE